MAEIAAGAAPDLEGINASSTPCPPPKQSSSAASDVPRHLKPTSATTGSQSGSSPKMRAAQKRAEREAAGIVDVSPTTKPAVKREKSARKVKEEKEPVHESFAAKAWSLKSAFKNATWSINLAKAFAPKMELGARNRVKVGMRFRPLNESETKRGDAGKAGGYLRLEPHTSHVTLTNPKPSPGQEAKTDMFAYDRAPLQPLAICPPCPDHVAPATHQPGATRIPFAPLRLS